MNTSIRRFFLIRADGEQKDLNGADSIWLTDPAGLGVTKTPAYANLNYGFFTTTDDKQDAQEAISFTLNFTGLEPYYDYSKFVDWIFAATGLYIGYQPEGSYGDVYTRPVSVKSIAKTELNKVGWLTAAVTLECLAPWTREITLTGKSGSILTYNIWSWEATANGQLPAAFRLSYKAKSSRSVNKLELTYALEDEFYQKRISFPTPLQLAAGETLRISTAPNDYYIQHINSDGDVLSVMDKISVSDDPLILLPPGASGQVNDSTVPAVLQLYVDAIDDQDALDCTMLAYYRTV